MSRILVTGGNGFIASHLVDALVASGKHWISVLDLRPRAYDELPSGVMFVQSSVRDIALIRSILQEQRIDVVYHTAWATIHETALKDPVADIEANLVPTIRLLEACRDVGVKRIIYLSSGGTVYGLPQILPVREDHPTRPINAYGITKLAVEKYLKMYSHLYGLEYVIFRPSVPYGPRQNPHRRQGAVSVFTYHALRGKPVTIWGNGNNERDYFYVEDMISALITALDLPFTSDPIFNLAGSQAYTLNQLVHTIENVLSVKMKICYESARNFDVPSLKLDTSTALEKLGWKPLTPLCEGIRRTAEWIQTWID